MVAIEGNERMLKSLVEGVRQGGQKRVAILRQGAKCDEINFKEGRLKDKGVK